MRALILIAVLSSSVLCSPAHAEQSAPDILKAARIQGGLIVHLGCHDGNLIAALGSGDNIIAQALDTDPDVVQAARQNIRSLGIGGTVSAELFDGHTLPYVDSLVNLLVAEDLQNVPQSEVTRVLCPGGVALLKTNGSWTKTVKPWPDEIDDWTHYLYDPSGSSVSKDSVAGHPRGLRWTGGPFWARSHEHTASMQAMVSAAGRIFYVMDEGPVDSIQLPCNMVLTARDAFNGTVLWKRPLKDWSNALFPLKSGPGWLPRRLVAVDDRVYVAPGVGQDLLCLDAVTGETVCKYEETASTFELIVSDGIVLAAVDPNCELCDYKQEHADCWKERDRASVRWGWNREQGTRIVKAFGAEDAKLLWQREMPVAPMTLTADARMVCLYDGAAVVAFDRKTGDELWRTDVMQTKQIRTGYSGPRMVICPDRVVLSPTGQMVALAADSGKVLWQVKGKPRSGHMSLEDFYIIDDKVWVLGRKNNGVFTIYSLATGEVVEEISNPINSFYIHQRCYPGRATVRYQLPPIMGTTVYDMQENSWSINNWVRGGCVYGSMPANGLLYATPSACACYYQSKLNGFNAVSPDPAPSETPPTEQRLTKGPAFGKQLSAFPSQLSSWPTFRQNNARTGYVKTDVSADLAPAWEQKLETKLSQPVAADGRVFVSAVDAHSVHAFDAERGHSLWYFITGGRVNSPPTFYKGHIFFGSADGHVYALNADDGQLAWQFQAAPNDRKLVSYGQLESVWPLYGTVLIQDDKLYTVAGRSMFLDGGLRMLVLDPQTGQLIAENVMDSNVPGTDQNLQELLMGKHMPVAMPDILSGDGRNVYMKSQTFDLYGKRVRIQPQRPDTQYDEEVHLFSPISFLDDGWHQRTYWIFGRAAGEGWAEFQLPPKRVPCGRILTIDEENAYGYARDPELMCNTSVSEYRLYSATKYPSRKVGIPKLEGTWVEGRYPADNPLAAHTVNWKQLAEQPADKLSALDYNWVEEEPSVIAKAMVLANNQLILAGPRDVVDEKAMWGRSNEPAFQQKMAEQTDWLSGKHGAVLQIFNKTDGKKLAEHELKHLPTFDGMIASEESLYMSTQDGAIVCYRGK